MSDLQQQTEQLIQQARALLEKAQEARENTANLLREHGISDLPAYLEAHASALSADQREELARMARESADIPASQALTGRADEEPDVPRSPLSRRYRQMV